MRNERVKMKKVMSAFIIFIILFMIINIPVQGDIGDILHHFPHPGPWGHGLTWDGQYLWSSDYTNDRLYQLDPLDGTVMQSFIAPGPDPQGLTWDGQFLWYADSFWNDSMYTMIAKIDPMTGNVLNSFQAPSSSPMDLAWDGQYLWNVDWYEAKIYKLNPLDGSIITSFPSPGIYPFGLTWDGQYLWHSDWETDKIYKLDPADGSIILSLDAPGDYTFGLAFDGQFLWNLDHPSMIYQIDIEYTATILATIDIDPDTLNLKSKGKWITCYITLNEPYDVNDIDVRTVIFGDIIPTEWGDIQDDKLMVKFDRSDVEDLLSPGTYNLKVTGGLIDGASFEGYSDEIRVIDPGK